MTEHDLFDIDPSGVNAALHGLSGECNFIIVNGHKHCCSSHVITIQSEIESWREKLNLIKAE